ncbi:response regulator receiver domain protein [Leptospira interrogans serovar Valbuzzi str. Duyster]|uniref:sensor histidine kinase n=1 Tax=Leptospira interrogans TaxID=173 RepID=UPI0002BA6C55|nr:ATP-binding protein [Leptospira interrogans]EMJ56419.1 response regulator receiver domain protein [Leptospira interrogans serovar Valbuzzi str. Duyster]ENO71157.1 response regulator receiver domain protein [Leptospira interrogans serovar Valbuzzi str. Valbuzzi]
MKSKPKILIVDDKPENLIALEVVLKGLDVELVKALSGNEALKAILRHEFALALLDIQMPEMDGYELAGIIREENKTADLPFIFISAVYTDNLNVFKGYEKGAFSFITKPFQPEILINKVQFFIDKHLQDAALHELNESLRQKNLELEYSNKELDAFTYSVSHDLKAPLRAIRGYTKILKEDYEEKFDEEGKRVLGLIIDNSLKMSSLIDSLLLLSKLGKKDMKKKPIDMNQLVNMILQEFQEDLKNGKTSLEIKKLPSIMGDAELLKQVLINLISNAIKYSSKKENPKVEIGSSTNEKEITYYVKDNGAGFNMQYVNKLFGVFQRLHENSEFEGIGIGLAIVQRIVLRHGGRVWAEGELDRGATFFFSLPI